MKKIVRMAIFLLREHVFPAMRKNIVGFPRRTITNIRIDIIKQLGQLLYNSNQKSSQVTTREFVTLLRISYKEPFDG